MDVNELEIRQRDWNSNPRHVKLDLWLTDDELRVLQCASRINHKSMTDILMQLLHRDLTKLQQGE